MRNFLIVSFAFIAMILGSINANAQVLDYKLQATPSEVYISSEGLGAGTVVVSVYPIPLTGVASTWNAWIEGPNADDFHVAQAPNSDISSRKYIIRYLGFDSVVEGNTLVVEVTLLGLMFPIRIEIPIIVQP